MADRFVLVLEPNEYLSRSTKVWFSTVSLCPLLVCFNLFSSFGFFNEALREKKEENGGWCRMDISNRHSVLG